MVVKVSSLEKVVASADILCTQTCVGPGKGPVFDDRGTKPYIHVNAVGADLPNKTELPRSLLKRSFVCPDFLEQAVREGECQLLTAKEIGPSLVEVVKAPEDFRFVQEQPSVFDSTGFALEDHVTAGLLFDHATDLGLGTSLEIESIAADPRNPYGFVGPSSVVHSPTSSP